MTDAQQETARVRYHEVICPNCQSDIMREGWVTRFLPLLQRDFSRCDRCVDYIKALTRELAPPTWLFGSLCRS